VKRRLSGFSLVELMVAITLALIVTAAVISVFVGSRNTYQSTSAEAEYTDGGRTALDLIGQAARNAGYIACTETTYPWWSYPSPTNASDSLVVLDPLNGASGTLGYDFRYGIAGYEANGTTPAGSLTLPAAPVVDTSLADWTPALDATFNASTLTPPPTQVSGSDVLVLRSSRQVTPAYTTAPVNPGDTSISVNDATNIQAGQLVAISNCGQAVVFQVSKVTGSTINLGTTGAALPGSVSGANIALQFDQTAMVTPLTTTVYYIGKGSDGDSALKRLNLSGLNPPVPGQFTDEEVVPDIENMQVLYGVATTPNTYVPVQYVTADQVGDFRQVVSVKVALLAASPPNSGTGPSSQRTFSLLGTQVKAPNDNRQRRVFEATIAIRNQML
jgi:type IV pilus assembly protein PilW